MKGATTRLVKRLAVADASQHESRLRVFFIAAMAVVTLYVLGKGVFESPRVPDNFTNSGSASPGGHRGLTELLKESGYKVATSVVRLDRLDDGFFEPHGKTLVMLEPSPAHCERHEQEIRALFWGERNANAMLVLPKRFYTQTTDDEQGRIVLREGLYPTQSCTDLLKMARLEGELEFHRQLEGEFLSDANRNFRTRPAIVRGYLQYFRVLNAGEERTRTTAWGREIREKVPLWRTLLQTDDGRPVAVRNDALKLTVVADPDIFSNRFLGVGDCAALADGVFDAGKSRDVVFDEALHGMATQASLEYLAVRPPALWSLLSLLALIAFFYWHQATVLRPLQAEGETRRSRALVIEGAARLMERAQDYTAAARELVKRAHHALLPSRAHVHSAGLAGSTSTSLSREVEQRLHALRRGNAGEDGLVNVAIHVAALKREQALSAHVPAISDSNRKRA